MFSNLRLARSQQPGSLQKLVLLTLSLQRIKKYGIEVIYIIWPAKRQSFASANAFRHFRQGGGAVERANPDPLQAAAPGDGLRRQLCARARLRLRRRFDR